MDGGYDLLLLTGDAETEKSVYEASNSDASIGARLQLCRDLAEMSAMLAERPAPVALVDVDPHPMEALAALESLVVRHPSTRFVTLCREFRNDIVLEAMQVGARHCLVKSAIATDLGSVLSRLVRDAMGGARDAGRVITVLSARGGCGATTVAVNLAEELRLQSNSRTLLVDLDRHYGAVGTYLGVEGQFGVADILATAGTVDGELVTSTAAPYGDLLHVLLSPVSVDFGDPAALDFAGLDKALTACRQAYHDVVIDAARVPHDVAADLARQSVLTMICFELTVIDVRTTRNMIQALTDRGIDADKVVAVANRCRKRPPLLRPEDAEEALEGTEVLRLTNDFPAAMKALNYGKPLADVAPRSPLRKDLSSVARRIEDLSPSPVAIAAGGDA